MKVVAEANIFEVQTACSPAERTYGGKINY